LGQRRVSAAEVKKTARFERVLQLFESFEKKRGHVGQVVRLFFAAVVGGGPAAVRLPVGAMANSEGQRFFHVFREVFGWNTHFSGNVEDRGSEKATECLEMILLMLSAL